MHENEYTSDDDMQEENLLLLFDRIEQEEEDRLNERFKGISALRNNVAKQIPKELLKNGIEIHNI